MRLRNILLIVFCLVIVIWGLVLYVTILQSSPKITNVFVNGSILVLLAFLALLIFRYFALMYFSYVQHIEHQADLVPYLQDPYLPPVSVLIPAYNEGKVIANSIRSVMALNYPKFEIIVIDDGSTDETYAEAKQFEGQSGHCKVQVLTQTNQGKAAALNHGIQEASHPFILCIDGDSRLDPDSLFFAVQHMRRPEVSAVAGNVKVVNRNNTLTMLQSLEYIEGLNMVRRGQSWFHAVNIIPGPFGLFRKRVLRLVGGYDSDTFAEDCDLTVKILAHRGRIEYEPLSVSWTEAPEHVRDFMRQRYRWTRGILQSLRKHRAYMFSTQSGWVNTLVLWYMTFEAILWPIMNIFAHIFFLFVVLFYGLVRVVLLWWGQLTLLDMMAALYCVGLEEEDLKHVPYALIYRMFFVLFTDVCKMLASFEEMLGIEMTWGKLERKGRI